MLHYLQTETLTEDEKNACAHADLFMVQDVLY